MVVKPFIIGDYKQIKSSAEIHDLSASAKDSVSLFKRYGRSQSVEVDVEAAFDGSASAETDTRTMEMRNGRHSVDAMSPIMLFREQQ